MLKADIKRAPKLNAQIEEFTAIIEKLAGPTRVIITTESTDTTGAETIFDISDNDTEIKPPVFAKKKTFTDALIAHYTQRINDMEAEILTL